MSNINSFALALTPHEFTSQRELKSLMDFIFRKIKKIGILLNKGLYKNGPCYFFFFFSKIVNYEKTIAKKYT